MRQLFCLNEKERENKSMKRNRVELLAPAGNYEALKGAIYAGADAVYLGGEKFGARAYADNFTSEQICQGIRMAHLYGKRIYLTVNTLFKDEELDELYDFLFPYYSCGLDGVIVQDLGVVCAVREMFPDLPIHASTQMTLTGCDGVKMLQELGVTRVVPARELSLDEILCIKKETGIEVEAFVHGAMCYCYSGQCLFSSILGGRSGNRGRCAQPCRLPYREKQGKEHYPLSMKDMCTVHRIPELIECGIDSFKIEGRMKKAEYVAGVTAVYRKYIDRYYNGENTQIEEDDMHLLRSLYLRSEISEGYYYKKNGRDMITLRSPAYLKSDEEILQKIKKQYLETERPFHIRAEVFLRAEENARLQLSYKQCVVSVEGAMVQKAAKQPLTEEKVSEQLGKMGNTAFKLKDKIIHMEEPVFMPIREINELRRMALEKLEDQIILGNGLSVTRNSPHMPKLLHHSLESCDRNNKNNDTYKGKADNQGLHVCVSTTEQLRVVLQNDEIKRIYLESSLVSQGTADALLREHMDREYYIASPYIIRRHNHPMLNEIKEHLKNGYYQGVLIRNLETYFFLKDTVTAMDLVLDSNVYCWNRKSISFWKDKVGEFYLPVEENAYEWRRLLKADLENCKASAVIYGRIPMMISANCIENTERSCEKKDGFSILLDRYGKEFPVEHNCRNCYNVIYNSVPLSLHSVFRDPISKISFGRMNFTVETEWETEKIIQYFLCLYHGQYSDPYYKEFTTGHWKRGVE